MSRASAKKEESLKIKIKINHSIVGGLSLLEWIEFVELVPQVTAASICPMASSIQTWLIAFWFTSCAGRIQSKACCTPTYVDIIYMNTFSIDATTFTKWRTFLVQQFESRSARTLSRCDTFSQFTSLRTLRHASSMCVRFIIRIALAFICCDANTFATRWITTGNAEFRASVQCITLFA